MSVLMNDALSPACGRCREPGGTCFPGPCERYVNQPRTAAPTLPKTAPDPVAALLHLRAEMVRMALEVDALADLGSIVAVRAQAPVISDRMRNAAMRREMEEASNRRAP